MHFEHVLGMNEHSFLCLAPLPRGLSSSMRGRTSIHLEWSLALIGKPCDVRKGGVSERLVCARNYLLENLVSYFPLIVKVHGVNAVPCKWISELRLQPTTLILRRGHVGMGVHHFRAAIIY